MRGRKGVPSRETQGFKKRGRGWTQQIPASVLGRSMASCHIGYVQGWPDGDTHGTVFPWPGASRASCPGSSSLSWCCQCLPLSLCHGWLHWLGSEGPDPHSASPCLVLPPCLLAGRAGASATHPLSLSINLLGKHSLEQGSLSVCLSMVVLPMSLTQALWISLCSAVCWDASPPLGLLPARQQCRQDPARAG